MSNACSRRSFVNAMWLAGCGLSLNAFAQHGPSNRARRIGFLIGDAPTLIRAFEEELQALGYVQGDNLVVEKRVSDSRSSGTAALARELASMDLELIVAAALPQALAVRQANPSMPMVIGTCPGMISNGFASSLERPGGIYTGMEELPPGVTARRLQLLKSMVPSASRIALLSTTPGRGGHERQLADAEEAGKRLGVKVKAFRANSPQALDEAMVTIAGEHFDGLMNFQGGLSLARRQSIVEFAAAQRLPAIYQSAFFVEAGGLMAWAPDQEQQFREAARYVDRILKGAKPGDLPVHYASHYSLTISKGAAGRLGIELPAALIAEAERVLA